MFHRYATFRLSGYRTDLYFNKNYLYTVYLAKILQLSNV